MNRKGSLTIYFAFLVLAVTVVVIGAIVAPMGTLFSAELYLAGENIILDANESISNIQNASIRTALQSSTANALGQTANNIEVSNALFQYSWVFLIILVGFVTFLLTRRLVEAQAPGGFI